MVCSILFQYILQIDSVLKKLDLHQMKKTKITNLWTIFVTFSVYFVSVDRPTAPYIKWLESVAKN